MPTPNHWVNGAIQDEEACFRRYVAEFKRKGLPLSEAQDKAKKRIALGASIRVRMQGAVQEVVHTMEYMVASPLDRLRIIHKKLRDSHAELRYELVTPVSDILDSSANTVFAEIKTRAEQAGVDTDELDDIDIVVNGHGESSDREAGTSSH